MATEQSSSGSGNGFLYFAIGALIVGVGVLAWMFYNDQTHHSSSDTAIEARVPSTRAMAEAARASSTLVSSAPRTPVLLKAAVAIKLKA